METVQVTAAKRDGHQLPSDALSELVLGYARGEVPDYQMAAFLMAGYLRGFTAEETAALTDAMVASGEQLDLSRLSGPTVDKHSTGGVGDGTTLVVAPLAAELGLQVIKLSGRGLGHTGGTLDKLDAIPGMRTTLEAEELLQQVERIGLAVCAQTADLVPADRGIYALRDVTATVGSVPLIASSIMSKKLAGGAQTILLDVKTGSGAFMKDLEGARELADACVELGQAAGRSTGALVTDMSQPLSEMIGNAIEVREAIEVLHGDRPGRFTDLCLELAGHLAYLSGTSPDADQGRELAKRALDSGAALERFGRFIEAQGGDRRILEDPTLLPTADHAHEVCAEGEGWLVSVDTEAIGNTAAGLGAGRRQKDDSIDPAVGLELQVRIGDQVAPGEPLARVFARSESDAGRAERALREALQWSEDPQTEPPLVHDVIEPTTGRRQQSSRRSDS
jgi:pyrimidine-nucleoside phosphorylase